ncbi:MAG: SpoIIIAH-like family protein [Firmicutes bacterium]|nr:SpoIIIAH-like family protein [Bacillota bacterium]
MFYVISGKTLLRGVLIILAAACVLWLVWNSLDLDTSLPSGGIVLWPKWMPRKGAGEPAENGMKTPGTDKIEKGPEGEIKELEESLDEPAEPVESLGLDLSGGFAPAPAGTGQFTIVGGELIDEYLPVNPIYGEDFTLAVPTSGTLTVSVQPLSRRDSFSEFRWERDRSRSRQLETLQGIITDSSSSEEQRIAAQERLLSIMAGSEVEMELEGLLMAQGLPDAVVVLSESGVTVMVDTVLTEEEATRIGDTVSGMTGMSLEKIRIIDQRS